LNAGDYTGGSGVPAALVYETLGERTLALAQLARRAHPEGGYEPTLDRFVGPVLARCVNHRIPIIGNFGAANAQGAARPYVSANAYLGAMNFVLDGNLDGGVNDSINLDTHGKSLASMLLAPELRVPAALIASS